jgi:hypothetical protein
VLDPKLGGQGHLGVIAHRLPYALAALNIPQVINTLGMVLWPTINETVVWLQFVVWGKDGINIGAASVGKLDPDLEANGWCGHCDISWRLIPSRSGRSRLAPVDSLGAKGGSKTLENVARSVAIYLSPLFS